MVNTNQTAYALLPISFIGAVVNWSVLYAVLKLQTFNHSFGFLSANQATVDALHSTMFLLCFCPMVLLFLISLNRLCAVWAPYKYHNIFSERNTKFLICWIWVFTSTVAVFLYEILCDFYYDDKIRFLTFTDTEICGNIGWYGDFVKNSVIVGIVMILDLLTIIKVRKMSKKVVANISDQAQTRLSHREMRFLKQTVTQGTAFMLELMTYFFIPRYFEDKWVVFFATSFAWVAVHAVDGIVVFLFNPEVRKFLLCKEAKHRTLSTSQTNS